MVPSSKFYRNKISNFKYKISRIKKKSLQLHLEFKQVIWDLIYNLMKILDLECKNGFKIGSFN